MGDARVVDVVAAVGVAGDEAFGGREENVVAVGARVEQVGVERALTRRDQVDDTVLPLIHIVSLRNEFSLAG